MTRSKLRKNLEDLRGYINLSEIARASGGSKQSLNYWLKTDPKGSSFSPIKGVNELTLLTTLLLNSDEITEKDYATWVKYLNMSKVCKRFFKKRSSTIAINIKRNGPDYYRSEIHTVCRFLLGKLVGKPTVVKIRKPSTRKVGIRIKKS